MLYCNLGKTHAHCTPRNSWDEQLYKYMSADNYSPRTRQADRDSRPTGDGQRREPVYGLPAGVAGAPDTIVVTVIVIVRTVRANAIELLVRDAVLTWVKPSSVLRDEADVVVLVLLDVKSPVLLFWNVGKVALRWVSCACALVVVAVEAVPLVLTTVDSVVSFQIEGVEHVTVPFCWLSSAVSPSPPEISTWLHVGSCRPHCLRASVCFRSVSVPLFGAYQMRYV